jgi:hypothetical protein
MLLANSEKRSLGSTILPVQSRFPTPDGPLQQFASSIKSAEEPLLDADLHAPPCSATMTA